MADDASDLRPADQRRLLSFYDRLRERVSAAAARRSPRMGRRAAEALLLAPDLFLLLVRLLLDRQTPARSRALVGGALAYFLAPVDLFPEALLGGIGYFDDVALAVWVLAEALGGELETQADRHWSGDRDLRLALRGAAEGAKIFLGDRLINRVRALATPRRGT